MICSQLSGQSDSNPIPHRLSLWSAYQLRAGFPLSPQLHNHNQPRISWGRYFQFAWNGQYNPASRAATLLSFCKSSPVFPGYMRYNGPARVLFIQRRTPVPNTLKHIKLSPCGGGHWAHLVLFLTSPSAVCALIYHNSCSFLQSQGSPVWWRSPLFHSMIIMAPMHCPSSPRLSWILATPVLWILKVKH